MTDWGDWHRQYDDPESSLSRRLTTVRDHLGRILARRAGSPTQLVSLCSGDGRDALPVLAQGHREVAAVLVELDAGLAAGARESAAALGLERVEVRAGDAGALATLAGVPPADVLMLCGIFGNVVDADVRRTVVALPHLLAPGARVIWTRGRRSTPPDPTEYDGDPSQMIRQVFADAGFVEDAFVRPADAGFRVGVHRFDGETAAPLPDGRLFTFMR